jgi:hypothetical protein
MRSVIGILQSADTVNNFNTRTSFAKSHFKKGK